MGNDQTHYGNGTAAGFKGNSEGARRNSRQAAAGVNKTLGPRHVQMLKAWRAYGAAGAIPEQIANDTEVPLLCVRPRAGELVKRGLLHEVGRRLGGMGKMVTAYSVVPPQQDAA